MTRCDGTIQKCEFRDRIESLWDTRNFMRGAAWVLGGLNVLIVGILLTMFSWMMSHVRFEASPTASAPNAQHEASWTRN